MIRFILFVLSATQAGLYLQTNNSLKECMHIFVLQVVLGNYISPINMTQLQKPITYRQVCSILNLESKFWTTFSGLAKATVLG